MCAHFIMMECRPFLVLYLAYRSFVVHSILYEVFHSPALSPEFESNHRNSAQGPMDLAAYMGCARTDVKTAIGDPFAKDEPACIPLEYHTHMFNMCLNLTAAAVCVVAMVTLVIGVCCSGATSIGHGRYIAYTTSLKKSWSYRAVASLQCFIVAILVAQKLHSLYGELREGKAHKAEVYAEDYGPEILLLVASCAAMLSYREVTFDVEQEEFKALHFKRGVSAVVSESNFDFCAAVDLALHKAGFHEDPDMSELVSDDSVSYEELLHICRPKELGSAAAAPRKQEAHSAPFCSGCSWGFRQQGRQGAGFKPVSVRVAARDGESHGAGGRSEGCAVS